MLLTLSQLLRRRRRRVLICATVLAVSLTVIAAHSATRGDHHMGENLAMCLAIAESALAAVGVALARPSTSGLALRLAASAGPIGHAGARGVTSRARAGPAALQVFRR
jgi:hypothetical protein